MKKLGKDRKQMRKKTRTFEPQGTNIIPTANFLHASSVDNPSHVRTYCLSWSFGKKIIWYATKQSKRTNPASTYFNALFFKSLYPTKFTSKHLYFFFPLKPTPAFVAGGRLKPCYFSQKQTKGDLSPFLTGNFCRNQILFLLRSAGVERGKKTQTQMPVQPFPPMTERAGKKIKNIQSKKFNTPSVRTWQTLAFFNGTVV